MHSIRTLLSRKIEAELVLANARLAAPDRAVLTLVLSQDQRLVRDHYGRWNQRHARRQLQGSGQPAAGFCSGFNDKTIQKLIESGRVQETKYDGRGRPTEVTWVRIN